MNKFSYYASLGFSVIPLRGKMPLVSWKMYQDKHADQITLAAWDNTSHNIGIVTGHISGILVVDVDGEYPKDWPKMPATWTVKTKKGYHYYFNLTEDQDYRNSTRIAENVDIRSNGGYVVAPPSTHPDGGVYEWLDGMSPSEQTLADIPDFLIDALKKHDQKLYEPQSPVISEKAPQNTPANTQNGREDAYIQAAIDGEINNLKNAGQGTRNDQLNKSAFALCGLIGAEKTKSLLHPVAIEIGLNYVETQKTLESACKSARHRDIPAGSYTPPPESPDKYEMPLIVRNILKRQGREVSHSELSPKLISSAPGLIGKIISFTLETSLYPQPVLALAAAIPCVGNIMAHRVKTETDLRTNFFTLGIAESGSGKDHARKVIAKIYRECGMDETLLGDPASATAVFNSIKRSDGHGLMRIDEFGRFMESLKGNNAASHNRMITTNMMHMYNNASDFFRGQEYADNEAHGGRADIDQPCLNIYATTVSHRFYNALSSEDAYDGFLSRWLVFETNRFDIDPRLDAVSMHKVPQNLIDYVNGWRQRPIYTGDGNLGNFITIKPQTVNFSDDARRSYHAFIRECRVKMSKSDNPIEKAFWNRSAEHAAKLSLIAHEKDYIDSTAFEWAVDLSKALTIATVENIKANVSDNAYEAELQNILKMIASNGFMSKSEITRRTQRIDRRKRQDILDTLVEGGFVTEDKKDNPDGGRPITVYTHMKT